MDAFIRNRFGNQYNAGLLLEIAALDHLIVTDDGFCSFADDGAL
jgi:DNA repair protein RadC